MGCCVLLGGLCFCCGFVFVLTILLFVRVWSVWVVCFRCSFLDCFGLVYL